jgi:hypothetical protein
MLVKGIIPELPALRQQLDGMLHMLRVDMIVRNLHPFYYQQCIYIQKILKLDYTIGDKIINSTFSKNFYLYSSRLIKTCYKLFIKTV